MTDLETELLGALARGFCPPENEHKEMDSTLCKAQLEELLKLPILATPIALLVAAFEADPDYAHGFHANIACMLTDEGIDHATANDHARGFMKRAFDVEGYEPKRCDNSPIATP